MPVDVHIKDGAGSGCTASVTPVGGGRPELAVSIEGPWDRSKSGDIKKISAIELSTNGKSVAGFQITGEWVGNIVFESTINGYDWTDLICFPTAPGSTLVISTLVNGSFRAACGAFQSVRVRAESWTSGTARVLLRASPSPAELVPLSINSAGRLLVDVEPLSDRGFRAVKANSAGLPAVLTSEGTAPFAVGGETLNIDINGDSQTCNFPTSAESAGTSTSGADPSVDLGGSRKMKVSIDGGASTEIDIGKDRVGGPDIASRIEDEIQSDVPNGSSATCDYNDTTPGRYVVTSGSTGSSSSVVIVNSGKDNMADNLKLGVANGGTEVSGESGDDYSADDVVVELNAQLTDIYAYVDNGDVVIETQDIGDSATLEVTGGAANTDLDFPTDEVTGSPATGAVNLAVDGSTTEQVFRIEQHASRVFTVTRLIYSIRDSDMALNKFGGITALTNGVIVKVENSGEPLREWFTFKTNSELLARARDGGQLIVDAYTGGEDLIHADFLLEPGIPLRPGSVDKIQIIVRDDLSSLTNFDVLA